MMEIDLTDLLDDAVAIGVSFTQDQVELFVLPTTGDGFIAVDVVGYDGDTQTVNETVIVRQEP